MIRQVAIEKNEPVYGGIIDGKNKYQRPKGTDFRQPLNQRMKFRVQLDDGIVVSRVNLLSTSAN